MGTNDIEMNPYLPSTLQNRLIPPSNARSFRKLGRRSSSETPASCRFADERITQPSRATLAAIATAARQFSDDGLQELRSRFVEECEHPMILRVINDELQRRGRSSRPRGR